MPNEIIKQNDKVSNLTGDVTITAPVQFDHLEFNGSSKWVNSATLTMAGDIVPSTDGTRSIGTLGTTAANNLRFATVTAQNINAVHRRGQGGTETITNTSYGGIVFGRVSAGANRSAVLEASSHGSLAGGFATSGGYGTKTASIKANGIGSFAHGYAYASGSLDGEIRASGKGAFAGGTTFNGGTIWATGDGSFAQGYGFAQNIVASANNSFQFGPGTNATSTALQVGDAGIGGTTSVTNGIMLNGATPNFANVKREGVGTKTLTITGIGAFAGGNMIAASGQTSLMTSSGAGSFASGTAKGKGTTGTGTIEATSSGAIAGGYAGGGGSSIAKISAAAQGAFAHGSVNSYTIFNSNINANGVGSIAGGYIIGATAAHSITATGAGSFAQGKIFDIGSGGGNITATGNGSMAIGSIPNGGASIIATPDNSWQFGPGTNAVAGLQVGDTQTSGVFAGTLLRSAGGIDSIIRTGVGTKTFTPSAGTNTIATITANANIATITNAGPASLMGGRVTSQISGTTTGNATMSSLGSPTGNSQFMWGDVSTSGSSNFAATMSCGGLSAGAWAGGRVSAATAAASIVSDAAGSFAHGSASSGSISATAGGSHAFGQAASGGIILGSGIGSFTSGLAQGARTLTASNHGSWAGGYASSAGITASGIGSFAIGSASATASPANTAIAATAENSFQFGPGTNATASSLQVGDITTAGVMLDGATPRITNLKVATPVGTNAFTLTGLGSISSGSIGVTASGKTATWTASGEGSFACGKVFASSNSASMIANGAGAWVGGYVRNEYGSGSSTSVISASGIGSMAHGSCTRLASHIYADAAGAHAFGQAYTSGLIWAHGSGSLASGRADTLGNIKSIGSGSFVSGFAQRATVSAVESGSVAVGYSLGTTSSAGLTTGVTANTKGSFAGGYSKSSTGINLIQTTTNPGSFAFGNIVATTGSGNNITASGLGAVALGNITATTEAGTKTITASGTGSLAIGSATAAITASAENSFQFGPGTNAVAGLQVGDAQTRNASATPVTGVLLQPSGQVVALSTIGLGTKTTTFTGTGFAGGTLNAGSGKTATMTASGAGSICLGYVTTSTFGSTMKASGLGSAAMGYVKGGLYQSGYIYATGKGAMARGNCVIGGRILSSGAGAMAFGNSSYGTTITASGAASFTGGYALGSGSINTVITASANSSFCFGYGKFRRILASNVGSFALGSVKASAGPLSDGIVASSPGTFSQGYVSITGAGANDIRSSAGGAFAGGLITVTNTAGTGNNILASGKGSFARGNIEAATDTNNKITASGSGSLAVGSVSATASPANTLISATAENSFQFGPGTNATATSLQVGISSMLTSDGQVMGKALKMSTTAVSTTPYDVLQTGFSHLVTTAASTIICNLPTAATSGDGKMFTFTKVDSGAGSISIVPNGAELINGSNTPLTISAQWTSATLICNGTGWIVVFNGNMYGVSAYISVSVSTVLTPAHSIVAVDASSGDKTITLPVSIAGQKYSIKKTDSSLYIVYIVPDGLQLIDEDFNYTLELYNEFVQIVGTGTGWLVTSE